jgi:hypothetical protein
MLSNCILTILAASPEELITRDHQQVHGVNLPEVWEKEFRSTILTATLWTILCAASLSYRSMQSLITKLRT